ncbi:hypothetical protein Pen01_04090 [Phytomonospora endophytica]|nr:hypothetical protein Pen01_04090 [Phytomonospora endophytica]
MRARTRLRELVNDHTRVKSSKSFRIARKDLPAARTGSQDNPRGRRVLCAALVVEGVDVAAGGVGPGGDDVDLRVRGEDVEWAGRLGAQGARFGQGEARHVKGEAVSGGYG